MSLPPETVGLLSDFLAALTGLLYVVGGYFLGKRESDKDFGVLYEAVRHVVIHMKNTETSWAMTYRYLSDEAKKRGEELLPLPFADYSQVIRHEIDGIERVVQTQERKARISLVVGVACLGVGTALFVVRLML